MGMPRLRAAMPGALFDACLGGRNRRSRLARGMASRGRRRKSGTMRSRRLRAIRAIPSSQQLLRELPHAPIARMPLLVETLTAAAQIDPDAVFEPLLERTIYDGAIARAEHWRALLGLDAVASRREALAISDG